jgi:hypothetical protein
MPMNGSRCTPAHGAALLAMAGPQIQEGRDPRAIRHGYLHVMLTTQLAGIDLDVATFGAFRSSDLNTAAGTLP